MTPSQETAELAVTQADRILAARFLPARDYEKVLAGDFDYLSTVRDIARHRIASLSQAGQWPLQARVRTRGDEKLLEIEGAINDTFVISRHTQPLSVADEDVPGLPTLYASPPVIAAVAVRKALEIAHGIVEADLFDAKEHADADWIGQSQKAFDALTTLLATPPSVPAQAFHIVWNEARNEGFITDDEQDALACLSGGNRYGGSTVGIAFSESYEDDDLSMETITLPATPPAQDQKGDSETGSDQC